MIKRMFQFKYLRKYISNISDKLTYEYFWKEIMN